MTESAPQPEKANKKEVVPAYIFDKTWQEGNFPIPTDDVIRAKLYKDLEEYSRYGIMHLSENKKARAVVLARIAAIDGYDSAMPKTQEQVSGQMESRKDRLAALAKELSESHEAFPFPGLNPETYAKLKADIEADEGRSDYDISSPTIDELVERFKNEGMKISLGDTPEAGNIFILPVESNDIQSDSLFLKHLNLDGITDQKLRELFSLQADIRSFAPRKSK